MGRRRDRRVANHLGVVGAHEDFAPIQTAQPISRPMPTTQAHRPSDTGPTPPRTAQPGDPAFCPSRKAITSRFSSGVRLASLNTGMDAGWRGPRWGRPGVRGPVGLGGGHGSADRLRSLDRSEVLMSTNDSEVVRHADGNGAVGEQLPDRFDNPGLPPHRPRLTDTDPAAARRATRQVVALFTLSILGTIGFVVAYALVPAGNTIASVRLSNLLLGLGHVPVGHQGLGPVDRGS